jgi:hypothetical protein
LSADKRKSCGHERREAKALLKAVRIADLEAIRRAEAVMHSFVAADFTLMGAQHVIAREKGHASWSAMLASVKPRESE